MKIYTPTKKNLIRLQIRKQGFKTAYITFEGCTLETAKEGLKKLIQSHIKNDPFAKGRKTSFDFREAIGGENGKSESFSFISLEPEECKNIIFKYFQP